MKILSITDIRFAINLMILLDIYNFYFLIKDIGNYNNFIFIIIFL